MIFIERNAIIFGEILTCDPSIYTMDDPDFIVCSFMENSIGTKRVNIMFQMLISVSHIFLRLFSQVYSFPGCVLVWLSSYSTTWMTTYWPETK